MRARVLTVLAAMVTAIAVSIAPTPRASAAASENVSLSRDGSTWSTSLPTPLFDEGVLWVPGDTRVARFYVRNDAASNARMTVDFLSTRVDDLVRIGDLEVSARVDSGPWGSTDAAGLQNLSDTAISAGGVREVEIRVTLPESSPNLTQLLDLDFKIQVTLTEDATGGLTPTGGSPDDSVLLIAGGVAIAGGVLLAMLRRRDEPDAEVRRG